MHLSANDPCSPRRPRRARINALAAVIGCLLSACAANIPPPATNASAMTAMQEPLVMGPTVDGYTYTNEPKLTRLGPHRFMIPANYFSDQMGPDFQGGVLLELVWPQLGPAPPGRTREMSRNEQNRLIQANVDYIEKLPLQETMDSMQSGFVDDPVMSKDPVDNMSQRTRGEDVLGLQRWYVSEADKARYLKLTEGQRDLYAWPSDPWYIQDWFVRRDIHGHVLTFIKCDPPSKPDGLIIHGDTLVDDGNPHVALCSHTFSAPKFGIKIRASYPRVLMRDWERVESNLHVIFERYHVGRNGRGGLP